MLSASYSSAHTTSVSPDTRLAKRDCGIGQRPQDDAVEVGLALVPVVGVALQHHAVAGRPRLDDEGPGADGIAVVVVALGLDRRRRMDGAVLVGPRQQRGEVHRRILERVDDRQVVLGFDAQRVGDVEGAAAVVLGVLLAVEVEGHRLGVERRAVRELHVGPELEGPGLEVVGRGPRQGEAGLGLAVLAEPGELLEEQAGGDVGRGVVDADLQRIEARDVELDADGERAALLLGQRRRGREAGDGGQRQHDLEQTRGDRRHGVPPRTNGICRFFRGAL